MNYLKFSSKKLSLTVTLIINTYIKSIKHYTNHIRQLCVGKDWLNTQQWELGKKYDSNFIFTFAVVKVRYGGITTTNIFKHGNYLK